MSSALGVVSSGTIQRRSWRESAQFAMFQVPSFYTYVTCWPHRPAYQVLKSFSFKYQQHRCATLSPLIFHCILYPLRASQPAAILRPPGCTLVEGCKGRKSFVNLGQAGQQCYVSPVRLGKCSLRYTSGHVQQIPSKSLSLRTIFF